MRLLHLQFADFAARFSVFIFFLLLQLVAITAHATEHTAEHTVPQKCGLPLLLIKFTLSLQNEVLDADSDDAFGRRYRLLCSANS